jgi:hypothetical protein
MLDIAKKYEDKLKLLFSDIAFNDRYKFASLSSYRDEYKSSDSTWSQHEFASVDGNGNILGYLKYSICRDSNSVYGLHIVNFQDKPSIIFARDLKQFLTDIFDKFKFRKISFNCVVDNPIYNSYLKIIERYGGRLVGFQIKQDKLIDGEYYDRALFEIMRENYLNKI